MWKALAERTSCAAGTPVGSKATQPVPPRAKLMQKAFDLGL